MKKKDIYLIIGVIILVLMLIPIPMKLKDGGSIEYKAILYSVTKYHTINPKSAKGYDDGWKVKVLGVPLYDEINTYVEAGKKDKEENKENISLSIKDNNLSKDGGTIILKNNTDKEYTYGPDFYLEKYDNVNWIEPSTLIGDPLAWNSIAYTLKANESIELNINFKSTYGELSKGKYRIIKRIFKNEDIPITEDKIIKLSVEFEIK